MIQVASSEEAEILNAFLLATKHLYWQGLFVYGSQLLDAPEAEVVEFRSQWNVFTFNLPLTSVILQWAGRVFDGDWSKGTDIATSNIHMIIGMYGSWMGESNERILQLLDIAEKIRPDVDTAEVRQLFQ